MTYFERIDELRDNTNFTAEHYETEYLTAELVLTDLFGEYLIGAELNSKTYGTGKVTKTSGDMLDRMNMEVTFADGTKKFGVMPIITGNVLFNKFADISEIGDAWDHAFDLHTDLTKKYNELKEAEIQQILAAKKKAEDEKKAEEKYNATRARAIRDFEKLTNAVTPLNATEEFYYALGWLAKHIGTVTAKLPDYLADSFIRHFGSDTTFNAVDSTKRTVNGHSMQWTFGFTANLRNPETIPAVLTTHLGYNKKHIADTPFIWDLVDNYGFQFGKTQDVEKIRSHVPSDFLSFFEAGLA